ncbi:MAG: hypothetical protein V4619_06240 [Bacteroidota bacterium]
MDKNTRSKCDNCGAGLKNINGELHCTYCGSTFPIKPTEPEPELEVEVVAPVEIENRPANTENNADMEGWIVGIFIFVVIAGILFNISKNNQSGDVPDADSLYNSGVIIDTSIIVDSTEIIEANEATKALNAKLTELESIKITKATFKSLYKNTRKNYDEFSKNTDIYDWSSPQYINYRGVFAYITKGENDLELRLQMQYVDDEWLYIDEVIFNTDGENHTYSSWKFSRGSNNSERWEWYDTNLTSEPSTLVAIATAKTAKVKYIGDDYYKIVVITKKQQAAIKRQLQIYKGLLLGYNK